VPHDETGLVEEILGGGRSEAGYVRFEMGDGLGDEGGLQPVIIIKNRDQRAGCAGQGAVAGLGRPVCTARDWITLTRGSERLSSP